MLTWRVTDTRRGTSNGAAAVLRPAAKSLPAEARAHNRALVLRTLFHSDGASRAEISRMTGITPGTTSALVKELTESGLVDEHDPRRNQRLGAPSTPLGIRADAYHIVALDLSDPEDVRGALLDLKGRPILRRSTAVGRDGVAQILDEAAALAAASTRPVLGVGVSCPGIIDPDGVVLRTTTYDWENLPLRELLDERLSLPVHVANDANTATLAEFTFGDARGDCLLTVTIGHGVGAGILLDGMIVQGDSFAVGEIGHLTAVEGGLLCECGRHGCLQTVMSAQLLREVLTDHAEEADARFADIGRRAGVVLAPLVGALTISQVHLSGERGLLRPSMLDAMRETIQERVLPSLMPNLTVSPATFGADTMLVGAAALVLSGELGIA